VGDCGIPGVLQRTNITAHPNLSASRAHRLTAYVAYRRQAIAAYLVLTPQLTGKRRGGPFSPA